LLYLIIVKSLSAQSTLHGVGDNGGVVPHEGVLGVGGILANLLVGVAESTTNGLGESNLGTGLEEVLSLEDVLWGKLTEVLRGGDLTGEEGGRKTGTLVHTATIGGGSGASGGASGWGRAERGVLTLNNGITRLGIHLE
tara:strand:+ start:260 stop:676 length:417 start_codon:yes stop_codon:yes gene_type:complete